MEADLVAYSMGIVAYMMLFIGNVAALRYLDSTLNQAFPWSCGVVEVNGEMKAHVTSGFISGKSGKGSQACKNRIQMDFLKEHS
jgi:hypothetical protein